MLSSISGQSPRHPIPRCSSARSRSDGSILHSSVTPCGIALPKPFAASHPISPGIGMPADCSQMFWLAVVYRSALHWTSASDLLERLLPDAARGRSSIAIVDDWSRVINRRNITLTAAGLEYMQNARSHSPAINARLAKAAMGRTCRDSRQIAKQIPCYSHFSSNLSATVLPVTIQKLYGSRPNADKILF